MIDPAQLQSTCVPNHPFECASSARFAVTYQPLQNGRGNTGGCLFVERRGAAAKRSSSSTGQAASLPLPCPNAYTCASTKPGRGESCLLVCHWEDAVLGVGQCRKQRHRDVEGAPGAGVYDCDNNWLRVELAHALQQNQVQRPADGSSEGDMKKGFVVVHSGVVSIRYQWSL